MDPEKTYLTIKFREEIFKSGGELSKRELGSFCLTLTSTSKILEKINQSSEKISKKDHNNTLATLVQLHSSQDTVRGMNFNVKTRGRLAKFQPLSNPLRTRRLAKNSNSKSSSRSTSRRNSQTLVLPIKTSNSNTSKTQNDSRNTSTINTMESTLNDSKFSGAGSKDALVTQKLLTRERNDSLYGRDNLGWANLENSLHRNVTPDTERQTPSPPPPRKENAVKSMLKNVGGQKGQEEGPRPVERPDTLMHERPGYSQKPRKINK